ncbi:MAG: cyclic nucleotide-binding domain-containing protein [Candidatus Binatia bacterium]|nr:cyclic nucleotide-binding domain-containing protein [Candidatus Binatia bacterium]
MQTLEPILAAHPFFQNLDPRHLHLIVSCASNVRFEAGQFIFREGEAANHFYLLRHGTVQLEIFVPERGPLVIQTLGEGDVLGWSWLFPPYRWHFDARAATLVRAIALDGQCLRTKCEEDHDLGYQLVKRFAHVIMQRLQATRLQLLDVYGVHS